MKVFDIIRYIVWYATENDIRLTTNRLVKFIYLADLYHARLKDGQTITGFPWRFIYYGPYCREAMQSIDQMANAGLICKESYDSLFGLEREYHIFSCKDEESEKIEETLHIGVLGQIQQAIRKFGDDTPQLLDYVYFNTEPMADAKKGDALDFTKARSPEPIRKITLKKLPLKSVKMARHKIRQLSDKMNADRERLIKDEHETAKYKDDAYYQFIKMLDGDDLAVGLEGIAKIQIAE